MKRLLLAASRAQPLLVVVEDLHWVDAETQSVLDGLVDAVPAARLLLVVNYRPEYRHDWSGRTYFSHVRLDPLGEGSGAALLDALLGAAPSLAGLKRQLLARTGGNPFFLEETVRALVETGALVGEVGARTPARALGDLEMPPTVQAVLAARIDRLAPEDKRVLQCAAVVGTDVALDILEAAADVPASRLRDALARLQAAEFLYEVQLFPDLAYTFTHALTYDVAYAGLLAAQRRDLHARIARAIEMLPAGRLTEPAERLSYHAFRGEVWPTAFAAGRQAARRFASLCSDEEAAQVYDRALDALSHLPPGRERDADDIDLRLEMRAVLWRRGRVDRLTRLFSDAEALATRLGDARRLNAVYAFLLQYHWAMGEHARAAEFGARCLEAADVHADRDLALLGDLYLGHVYYSTAEIRRAVAALDRVVERLETDPTYAQPGVSGLPYVMACAWATLALADAGESERARAMADRGEAVARKAEHAYSLAAVQVARGHAIELTGDAADAIAVLEPLRATCRDRHFVGWVMMADWALAAAYLEVGRRADALEAAREGRGLKDSTGARVWRGREHALLAEALLANGRVAEARVAAGEALASARAQAEPFSEALAYLALAAVAGAPGPGDRAEIVALLERAIAIFDRCGFRPFAARARRRLAAVAGER